jgi:hypothetical protein
VISSKHRIQILSRSSVFMPLLLIISGSISPLPLIAGISYPAEVSIDELKFQIPFKSCAEMQKYFNDQASKNKEDVRYQGFDKYSMKASSFEYYSGPSEKTYCNDGYIIKKNLQGTRICIGSLSASSVFNGNFSVSSHIGRLIYNGEVKRGNPTCRWRD